MPLLAADGRLAGPDTGAAVGGVVVNVVVNVVANVVVKVVANVVVKVVGGRGGADPGGSWPQLQRSRLGPAGRRPEGSLRQR